MSLPVAISRACGIIAAILGSLGLAGWILDSRLLTGLRVEYIPMAPNTALVIILLGISVYAVTAWPGHRTVRLIIAGFTGSCLLLSALTLAGWIAGIDTGVDSLLISTTGNLGLVPVGRMSPVTATCLLLVCTSLFLLLAGKNDPAALAGTAVAGSAAIILIGYLYGAPLLYGGTIIPVALTTAIGLGVLGTGLVFAAGPSSWPLSRVSGDSTRARLLRGLLPVILIVVLLAHWSDAVIIGNSDSTVVLFSAGTVLATLFIVYFVVSSASRSIGDTIDRAVNERKKAELALSESEERLKFALEGSNDGIWDVSMKTGRTYISPRGWEILGYPPGEQPEALAAWSDLVHPDDMLVSEAALTAYIEGWAPIFDVEQRLRTKSGEWKWVRARGKAVVRDAAGKPLRMTGTHTDISESKQAALQREMLISELEQKNAELERFTYTVSHDLKSPLITIKGFAGLLEDDAQRGDPVQLKKDIHRITEAAGTMQELLADVLELSRIGRVISPPEKVSFGTIAREAVDLLAGPLAERNVTVGIAPDLPEVYVDHARIREALTNLIENAIKFSGDRPDPVIRIGVEMEGGVPVFFVQDNGIGIDPRYLMRIFNLFERLDASMHGTGIGLTIVRRIIEVHGGKIWAESEGLGKGTTFKFTLPGVPPREGPGPEAAG